MKYLYSLWGLILFAASGLLAQNPCNCNIFIENMTDCCAKIGISWSPNCTPGQAQANHININSAAVPALSGSIQSVSLNFPQLSFNLSGGNTILDISSTVNIATLGPIGTVITLGTICYEDVVSTAILHDYIVEDNGVVSCQGQTGIDINCVNAEPWNKIYGDTDDNVPTKVKAFGDGLYVTGYRVIGGEQYGTISKFDITSGSLLWHAQHDIPSIYYDLEYSPLFREIIVVGETAAPAGTPTPFDNKSLIMRRQASNGQIPVGGLLEYDHPGREGFLVIKRHPFPEDENFPFYVLGTENPASSAPSAVNQVIAYNFNRTLASDWDKRYTEISGVEIEGFRGIVPLNDGDLLFLGNGSIANEGVVIKVDGDTGGYLDSWYNPDGIDWYDGVHLPNGFVILSGTRFASNEAILLAIDPFNGASSGGMIFQNQSTFREIGSHSLAAGSFGTNDLYTVAREKNNPLLNRNIVNKITFEVQSFTGPFFTYNWSRVLEDGETQFATPRTYVTPTRNNIFYADNRTPSPTPFGNTEMLVGSYDLDLTSDCMEPLVSPFLGYSVNPVPFTMFDANINITPVDQGIQPFPLAYDCVNYCGGTCTADFIWVADCCTVQFAGSAVGIGPFTYEWDFDCGTPFTADVTGQNPTWSFPGTGTYQVCLRVTDTATGAVCTQQHSVSVVDDPPVIVCPPDVTIPTDPGTCVAVYNLMPPMVTDDCTTNFVISCQMSGATTGSANTNPVTLNKGVTTITYTTEDSKGQIVSCSYQINVVDQEPPTIVCPSGISTSVAACAGGANVTFPPPTFADNCPMVTYVCSHQSGDFFPCGTTMVTCTATDMAGNQTTCTFPVTVDCECAEVGPGSLTCTQVDDQFAFSITVIDLTGAGPNGCTVNVSSSQPGITVSNVSIVGPGPGYTVTGLVDVTGAPPFPNSISLTVDVSCICPDGSLHDCSFTRVIPTICCKEIAVDPQEVCKNDGLLQIPLLGCNTLYDVQQVRWYVANAPCPPASWGIPFKVTNSCSDLILSPGQHPGDICVYAEVDLGPGGGPCRMLISNVATISLCDPISFTLTPDQDFCYIGSPITPAALSINLVPNNCLDNIEWYDPQGNLIPSASGQIMYQPPPLSFTLPNTACSQSYTYLVEVSNECGVESKTVTIRLDNENAPVGTLSLLPPDTNPLCPGEDAIVEYQPECAGSPPMWDWFVRPDAIPTYTSLPTNGTQNPLYHTNRLTEDTWVKVERTNGACTADEVELFLDVRTPISITQFDAVYDDTCNPTTVTLSADVLPNPAEAGCSYNVFWYQNSQLIGTTAGISTTPVTFNYSGMPLHGNYYVVVESTCCPGQVRSQIVTLKPEMEVAVTGPCFRCNCDTVMLTGIVLNQLSGFNCTYQWYDNGTPIAGATGTTLTVDPNWDGPFTFEVTCTDGTTTCVKDAMYNLFQCGMCPVSTVDLPRLEAVRLFPNPTQNLVKVELAEAEHIPVLEVFDMTGKLMRSTTYSSSQLSYQVDLTNLPDGVYLLRGVSTAGNVLVEYLIKS